MYAHYNTRINMCACLYVYVYLYLCIKLDIKKRERLENRNKTQIFTQLCSGDREPDIKI